MKNKTENLGYWATHTHACALCDGRHGRVDFAALPASRGGIN
jgi:hypothetical protein